MNKWAAVLVTALLLLTSCTVCRTAALRNAASVLENGYDVEFVLYTTTLSTQILSLGIWNAHVQATYKVNGKRHWVSNDLQIVSEKPDYPIGEYCWIMDIKEYAEYLKVCRELEKRPMPSQEYRDKHWPKSTVLKQNN